MTQWHGGKGSKSRPYSISQDEYDKRWDAIFGKDIPEEDDSDEEMEEWEQLELDLEDEHTEEK